MVFYIYIAVEVSDGRVGRTELKSVGSDNLAVKKLARASTSRANLV